LYSSLIFKISLFQKYPVTENTSLFFQICRPQNPV